MPKKMDWYEVKFLESSSNLKELIKSSAGRTPSTKIADEISVCIKQGRLFFETALSGPLEIQPLQVFYGVIGFAKAIALARKLVAIDTLAQAHGLSDVSKQNATVEQLSLKIGKRGTFQEFNDAIAPLGRLIYYEYSMPRWVPKPFDAASKLAEREMRIKEILARIPYLQHLYEKTFHEPAKTWHVDLNYMAEYDGYTTLRIDDPELYADRESLVRLVRKWRERFPFLNDWCLLEASLAWENSILIFCNIDKTGAEEFSTDDLIEYDGRFVAHSRERHNTSLRKIAFAEIMPPVAGGITRRYDYVIQPHEGVNLCEFSLHFLGCFLLSSSVRYRPQIWQHAISRSVSRHAPADDRSLAIIQRFLDVVLEEFPRLVVHSIEYPRLN